MEQTIEIPTFGQSNYRRKENHLMLFAHVRLNGITWRKNVKNAKYGDHKTKRTNLLCHEFDAISLFIFLV